MVDRGLSPPLSGTTFSELHRQTAGAAQINGQQLFQVHYEIGVLWRLSAYCMSL